MFPPHPTHNCKLNEHFLWQILGYFCNSYTDDISTVMRLVLKKKDQLPVDKLPVTMWTILNMDGILCVVLDTHDKREIQGIQNEVSSIASSLTNNVQNVHRSLVINRVIHVPKQELLATPTTISRNLAWIWFSYS